MKPLAAILALLALSSEASAISRYTSTSLSCAEVRAIVEEEGAAILRWQSERAGGLPRYDRFVAGTRFCVRGEGAFPAFVPTADRRDCPVLACEIIDYDDEILKIPRF